VWEYLKSNGIHTESCYPFKYRSTILDIKGKCDIHKCNDETNINIIYKINAYNNLGNDEMNIKYSILNNGPVNGHIHIYPDIMIYHDGIYKHNTHLPHLGNHSIEIVGWGIKNNKK